MITKILEEIVDHGMVIYKKDWRLGQTYFNAPCELHPDIANKIRNTENDPFFKDSLYVNCVKKVTELLKIKFLRVSFDFDDTLDKEYVQKYVKELITRGIEVWIVTSRFSDPYEYEFPNQPVETTLQMHRNLFDVAKGLGISKEHIKFTEMIFKAEYFKDNWFAFHVDDHYVELNTINKRTNVTGIQVQKSSWISKCEKILKKYTE